MSKKLQMQRKDWKKPGDRRRRPKVNVTGEPTYWNGRPCTAHKCIVQLEDGSLRGAVEVSNADQSGEQPFYLDNEENMGWRKVTVGEGSPWYGHTTLYPVRVVEYAHERRAED
jgi:hypothetical protein